MKQTIIHPKKSKAGSDLAFVPPETLKLSEVIQVNNIDRLIEFAFYFHICGELNNAAPVYKQLVTLQPNNAELKYLYGQVVHQMGDIEHARELLDQAIQIDEQAKYYISHGMLCSKLKDWDAATHSLIQALSMDPNLETAYTALNNLGIQLLAINIAQAIVCFKALTRIQPAQESAFINLSRALVISGKQTQASNILEKALKNNHASPNIYINLSCALWAQEKHKKSIMYFKKATQDMPIHINLRSVISVRRYCEKHSLSYQPVKPARPCHIYTATPFVQFPAPLSEFDAIAPELYVAELNDITLIGDSRLMLAHDGTVLTDFADDIIRYNRSDFTDPSVLMTGAKQFLTAIPSWEHEYIPVGISLIGKASRNFSHWLFEFLPRLSLLDSDSKHNGIPLLIDEQCLNDPHIVRTLSQINHDRHPLIALKAQHAYRIGKLILPSNLVTKIFNLKPELDIEPHDCIVMPEAISFLKKNFGATRSTPGKERIYLQRSPHGLRCLLNTDEVERVFKSYGFRFIEAPHLLDYDEKVALFANAQAIGGPGGTGFINAIFSPPETIHFLLVAAETRHDSFTTSIAHGLNQEALFITGTSDISRCRFRYHCDYSVDIEKLKLALSCLD